jgi:hypothetical protein
LPVTAAFQKLFYQDMKNGSLTGQGNVFYPFLRRDALIAGSVALAFLSKGVYRYIFQK